jgi:hypothetical protein
MIGLAKIRWDARLSLGKGATNGTRQNQPGT